MTRNQEAGVVPVAQRRLSAEEYYQLPGGPPYFQLIDGELFMSPSPNFFHQELVLRLAAHIWQYLQGNPIGKVIVAPSDVQFDADNIFQPDVFFIRRERLHIVDEQGPKGAPDLIAEVISGSTANVDLGPKKQIYAAHGVIEFWVIHPHSAEVEIYRLQDSATEPATVLRDCGILSTPLLPGWTLPLSNLFAQ